MAGEVRTGAETGSRVSACALPCGQNSPRERGEGLLGPRGIAAPDTYGAGQLAGVAQPAGGAGAGAVRGAAGRPVGTGAALIAAQAPRPAGARQGAVEALPP